MATFIKIEQNREKFLLPIEAIHSVAAVSEEIARAIWSDIPPHHVVRGESVWNLRYLSERGEKKPLMLKRGSRILYLADGGTAVVIEVVLGIYDSEHPISTGTRIVIDSEPYSVLSLDDLLREGTRRDSAAH